MYQYLKHGDIVSYNYEDKELTTKITEAREILKEGVSTCIPINEVTIFKYNIQRTKLADGTEIPRVGDYLINQNKEKTLILEVFENTFVRGDWGYNNSDYAVIYKFNAIDKYNWKIERAETENKCKECGAIINKT